MNAPAKHYLLVMWPKKDIIEVTTLRARATVAAEEGLITRHATLYGDALAMQDAAVLVLHHVSLAALQSWGI